MTASEAADLLDVARKSMRWLEACTSEEYALRFRRGLSAENAHKMADYVLPRGRHGHIRLVLYPPDVARATAFIAAVLRAVEEEKT